MPSDAQGIPLAASVFGADMHERLALKPLIRGIPAVRSRRGSWRLRPVELRADKAYFSAEHPAWLRERGLVARIARPGIESGEGLGWHRWKIERSIAWLFGYRRLTVRYERKTPFQNTLFQSARLTTSIVASGQRTAFLDEAVTSAHTADIEALAREAAVLYLEDSAATRHERSVATAESRLAGLLRQMAEYMGRAPSVSDGVARATVTALDAKPGDWPGMRREQNRQKEVADAAGNHALYLAAATALAVVAEMLAAISAVVAFQRAGL